MAEPVPPLAGHILMVCTGNIGRSPYLERRLRQLSAPALRVTSVGTRAVVGHGIEPRIEAELARLGADVNQFAARQLSAQHLTKSHLILTATKEHLRDLVAVSPGAVAKAFTVRHAARIIEAVPDESPQRGRTAGQLARWLMANRWRVRFDASVDDVADPYGADDSVTAQSIESMEAALQIIAGSLRA